jgi:hypothetical protein
MLLPRKPPHRQRDLIPDNQIRAKQNDLASAAAVRKTANPVARWAGDGGTAQATRFRRYATFGVVRCKLPVGFKMRLHSMSDLTR